MKATLIVIQNEADHVLAKALIVKLMDSKDAADWARLSAQVCLTEAYERSRWLRRAPSLPDLLAYLMDQRGLSRADLIPLFGSASRVSGVLAGKRELSMTMVRKLRDRFHIPADVLIPLLKSSKIVGVTPRVAGARRNLEVECRDRFGLAANKQTASPIPDESHVVDSARRVKSHQ